MNDKTTGQVAEALGTYEMRLQHLIRNGKLAKPKRKVGGKLMWSKEDQKAAEIAVKRNPDPRAA